MIKFETLYAKYVDAFCNRQEYLNGVCSIGEPDLYKRLGSEIDMLISEYGSLVEYADADEPEMLMELYSVNEAELLIDELRKRLREQS